MAILLLTGCGEPEEAQTSLTADEEQQLNDAAAMLDEPEDAEGQDSEAEKD